MLSDWLRKGGLFYDVMAYGAVGDDSTDNAAAFTAAVAAAGAYGLIFVPQGTYSFDSAFDLGTTRMVGVGGTSILKASATNSDAIIKNTTGFNPIYIDSVYFRSANTSAIGISGPNNHYITGQIKNCEFAAEFATAIQGLLGDLKLTRCDFGYRGGQITNCQAIKTIRLSVSYQNLNVQFEHCKFFNYQGTPNGTIEILYANTVEFEQCMFESLHHVAIHATAVANLLMHNYNFEICNPDTDGIENCLIYGAYDAASGTGTACFLDHCRFTNSATTAWDHVFNASGSSCWLDVVYSRGGLSTSYWCKDSDGNYDTAQTMSSRGILRAENNQITGYSGGAFFPGLSHIGDWDKSFASPSHDYGAAAVAWTMTELEAAANFFTTTNAGGAADAVFPRAVPGKQFVVYNNSGAAITFKVTGQSGSAVATGKYATFIMNATDCVEIYGQP